MAHVEAYKTFDRGTAAGRMLYNLYHKKNMDSTLDPDLLARLQKMRAQKAKEEEMRTKEPVIPKSRAYVNVPKPVAPRRSQSAAEDRLRAALGAGRKKLEVIEQERAMAPVEAPPLPGRRAITDEDKARLQHIMTYGEPPPPPPVGPLVRRRPPSEREIRLDRFEELADEIAERKEFLTEVKAGTVPCAKNPLERQATERRLLAEIADRVKEMKAIDAWLRDRPPTPD